jgi:hypothetical protein
MRCPRAIIEGPGTNCDPVMVTRVFPVCAVTLLGDAAETEGTGFGVEERGSTNGPCNRTTRPVPLPQKSTAVRNARRSAPQRTIGVEGEIEACLRSVGGKLYRMGFRGKGARSTLADANESRDWRIYADFVQVLIAIARPLYVREPIALMSTPRTPGGLLRNVVKPNDPLRSNVFTIPSPK